MDHTIFRSTSWSHSIRSAYRLRLRFLWSAPCGKSFTRAPLPPDETGKTRRRTTELLGQGTPPLPPTALSPGTESLKSPEDKLRNNPNFFSSPWARCKSHPRRQLPPSQDTDEEAAPLRVPSQKTTTLIYVDRPSVPSNSGGSFGPLLATEGILSHIVAIRSERDSRPPSHTSPRTKDSRHLETSHQLATTGQSLLECRCRSGIPSPRADIDHTPPYLSPATHDVDLTRSSCTRHGGRSCQQPA